MRGADAASTAAGDGQRAQQNLCMSQAVMDPAGTPVDAAQMQAAAAGVVDAFSQPQT